MARNTNPSKKPSKASVKKIPATQVVKTKAPAKSDGTSFHEVRTLIDLLKKNNLAVLEFEQGDLRIALKTPFGATQGAPVIQSHAHSAPPPAPVALPSGAPEATEPPKSSYKEITSPMVGTFYAAPSTDSPPYVEPGKSIEAESVVCIIEAMKVMNEIKAEITGKIVEVVAENGKPVQFGQVLFRVS